MEYSFYQMYFTMTAFRYYLEVESPESLLEKHKI